jgi:hypothetical protein
LFLKPNIRAIPVLRRHPDAPRHHLASTGKKVRCPHPVRRAALTAPGAHAKIRLHPLGPGRHPCMGEVHPDIAPGVVISASPAPAAPPPFA